MKRKEAIIVIFTVAIGLILTVTAYSRGYLDPFFSSLLDPLWMSVFVTTVLVIINIIYILQNYMMSHQKDTISATIASVTESGTCIRVIAEPKELIRTVKNIG